ncbi:hypothetical protein [Halolamina litorea]|uniref:Major facilitator superfamily (MFS) profile domain-containing protein n=1 Tax=Halolamina litorea TaxID=1515593 RepID=A0ABD6BQ95_9EURY|nr:hypothetical protein [Halolamina litorea]
MNERTRTIIGLVVGGALVVGGSLATGYLTGPRSQLIAGAIIVAGFAVGFLVLGEFEFPE